MALPLLLLLPAACAGTGGAASRPLNPVYDKEPVAGGEKVQVRPFYWKKTDDRGTRVNVLGPFLRWREDHVYERLQILPNVFYSARHSPAAERSWWFLFFPFLWLGNDDFLVFPLGGYSRGLLGLDHFLMVTPLFIRTKSVRGGDEPITYTVRHVLFPFLAWGKEDKGPRWKVRVAPFWGKSVGRKGARSGFVLWPFFTWRKGKDSKAWFLFPFYGRADSPTVEQRTILFPIYHRHTNLLTGFEDVAVWPFWRRAGGVDRAFVRRYWPLHEYRRAGYTTTQYTAWPFWRRTYVDDGRVYGRYTWVVPFYKKVEMYDRTQATMARKTTVWPAGRFETYPDGSREVAIPVLTPIDAPAIREWSESVRPFISLWHRRTDATGKRREVSALFGLYLARRAPERGKVRILGGLVGFDRDESGKYLRLFWGLRLRYRKAP